MTRPIPLKGFKIKGGKVEKIAGYGLSSSAKIARRKNANKPKVVARKKVSR
jgi:hypothetical protein